MILLVNKHRVACLLLLAATFLTACSRAQERTASSNRIVNEDAVVVEDDRDGTDWPHFLGPTHDGVSSETGLLDSWPEDGPPLVWEKDVGTGYSAPSIRQGRLVLHHREENREIVECFDAVSGKELWENSYPSRFRDPYGYNNGPRCSPLLTEEHCYTLGAEGKLLCLRIEDAELVWEHDLKNQYDIPDGFFGVGATPILEDNLLIVLVGGQPNAGVVAFNSKSGDVVWEAVGKDTWDGAETGWANDPQHNWDDEEMVVSYSSPVAATIHGKRHVLCLMRQGLVSLDPKTGKENFKHWFRSRAYESVNAARPVVVNDTILLSAAYRVGSTVLKVFPDGKSYDVLWSDPRNLLAHWSTPVYLDDCYFGFSGRHENEGELRCIDAMTGKVKWSTSGAAEGLELGRLPDGTIVDRKSGEEILWPYYGRGAKILVDGKFLVLSEHGVLSLLNATTAGWQESSRFQALPSEPKTWVAPVISHKRLYLRSDGKLKCYDLMANPESL